MPRPSYLRPLVAALVIPALAGCFYSRRAADVDKDPTVDTGMGASIIMPGQTAPPMSFGGAEPAGSEASSGGSVGRPNITMVGGSEIDSERHETGKEDPLLFKAITAPLAVVAAPFVAVAEAMKGDPEPGPPVPEQKTPRPEVVHKPVPKDYETRQIEKMEQELARRQDPGSPPTPSAAPRAAAPPAPRAGASIADELAALQRAPEQPAPAPHSVPTPFETDAGAATQRASGAEVQPADGIVDRDEDGRIDLWIYRLDGEIVRKTVDQDFDGRPDTTMHYDPATHRLARIEEDSDRDGSTDSWADYRDGEMIRRRVDADGDGSVDTWTFYRDGKIARHERDSTGDGFRDRVSFYRDGQLAREEEDTDGDGRADVIRYYDANEHVARREEDTDHDGSVDVISHFENGRLARRELLGDATATP